MASFHFLAFSILFMVSSTISLPLNSKTPPISAAPALLPDPPLSPYTQLSPDIYPVLPSPGGTTRSPSGSSNPTIPSTRSTDPDAETSSIGPDTAFAPSGSLQDSSALPKVLLKGSRFEVLSASFVLMIFML